MGSTNDSREEERCRLMSKISLISLAEAITTRDSM